MSNSLKVKLSVLSSNESSISDLQKQLMQAELEAIEEKHPIVENQICIDKTYQVEFDRYIEVGFFIRNTLPQSVNFEYVPLVIVNSKEETVFKGIIDLMDFGKLPSMSARSGKIEIEKEKFIKGIKYQDLKLFFDFSQNNMKAEETVEMKIENMPENMNYKERKELEEYFASLLRPRKGTFDINIYKIEVSQKKGISLILILRNATNKTASIESLPISIVTKSDIKVFRTIFKPQQPLTISPRSAKILDLNFKITSEVLNSIKAEELIVRFE